jgi:hypothetical protein
MEHFRDLLFQFVKHGTNTLHTVFIFLFHIERVVSHSQISLILHLTVTPKDRHASQTEHCSR